MKGDIQLIVLALTTGVMILRCVISIVSGNGDAAEFSLVLVLFNFVLLKLRMIEIRLDRKDEQQWT